MQNEQTSLRCFNVLQKLGEGSFSCVYKVQRIGDTNYYAMKKVKINQMKQKQKQNALNEVRILASITHPNIINYRQAFFDQKTQTLCVVMELADAGDVQKKINIHKANKTFFNEVQIWQALIQMAKGLKVLHQIQILHRDLKCANVFCTKDGKYKLGDLNVSKVVKRGMARTQTGTPYYTSPEVWNDRPYDSKCDIWSLGCVVYEMAALFPPFRATNLKQLFTKIQKGLYPNIPPFYSDDLRYIISQCLKVSPSLRPSASELLQHPKVVRNMPSSQVYNQQNNLTCKAALLKTIIVPKNMKQLKQALPGSKYDKDISTDRKYRRASSAQNLRNQISPVVSPKNNYEPNKYNLKYALLGKPSNQRPDQKSQSRSISRNNSSAHHQISQRVNRVNQNNSVDYIRQRLNSRQSQKGQQNQRKLNNELSKDKVQVCMQDISSKCKQIQQRVQNLMNKKRQSQEQRNPNLPTDSNKRRYLIERRLSGKQRDQSVRSNRSRNSSVARNNSYRQIQIDKYQLKKNQSVEIINESQSRQRKPGNQRRALSKEKIDYGLPLIQQKDSSKKIIIPNCNIPSNRNYLCKVPPKYK